MLQAVYLGGGKDSRIRVVEAVSGSIRSFAAAAAAAETYKSHITFESRSLSRTRNMNDWG